MGIFGPSLNGDSALSAPPDIENKDVKRGWWGNVDRIISPFLRFRKVFNCTRAYLAQRTRWFFSN